MISCEQRPQTVPRWHAVLEGSVVMSDGTATAVPKLLTRADARSITACWRRLLPAVVLISTRRCSAQIAPQATKRAACIRFATSSHAAAAQAHRSLQAATGTQAPKNHTTAGQTRCTVCLKASEMAL
jgi:hypothetical protein